MKTYLDMLCLQVLAVFFVDIVRYWRLLTGALYWLVFRRWRAFELKPFSCSFCTTFWACLAYLIIYGAVSLRTLTAAALLAVLTPVTLNLIFTTRDLLNKLIAKIC